MSRHIVGQAQAWGIYRQSPIFLLLTKILFSLLVNKTDLKLYTLVGLTVTGPVQDPLAVTHFENRLYIHKFITASCNLRHSVFFFIYFFKKIFPETSVHEIPG